MGLKYSLFLAFLILLADGISADNGRYISRKEMIRRAVSRFNRYNYLDETLYAAFHIVEQKQSMHFIDLVLAPTHCSKFARYRSEITLKKCRFNNKKPFKRVHALVMKGSEVQILSEIFENNVHEYMLNLNYDILGFDTGKNFDDHFKQFKTFYGKNYATPEEEFKRKDIFSKNMHHIELLGILEQGSAAYGVTKFADMSPQEFKKNYTGLLSTAAREHEKMRASDFEGISDPLPEEFNWKDKGAVTPVKNQGSCGSCWAFSVTGNVEGQWFLKHKQLYSLSEQELVDCDKIDQGCNGGLPLTAYHAIMSLHGLTTEDEYPYEAEDDTCNLSGKNKLVTLKGANSLSKNETVLQQWLFKNGPISIGINANFLQFYWGGVSHPPKALCSASGLDHGVLAVGYGTTKSFFFHEVEPFWVVKNSWGEDWGEDGYFRVYRGDGCCGVNALCSTAIVN